MSIQGFPSVFRKEEQLQDCIQLYQANTIDGKWQTSLTLKSLTPGWRKAMKGRVMNRTLNGNWRTQKILTSMLFYFILILSIYVTWYSLYSTFMFTEMYSVLANTGFFLVKSLCVSPTYHINLNLFAIYFFWWDVYHTFIGSVPWVNVVSTIRVLPCTHACTQHACACWLRKEHLLIITNPITRRQMQTPVTHGKMWQRVKGLIK